jgi:hypothetical protein
MVINKKEVSEHRKHGRFKVKNGAIAIIRFSNIIATTQKYTQILNISRGGLAFRTIDRKGESNKPAKLDLLFIYDSICTTYLKYIPLKTIYMSHIDSKNSFNPLRIKKQGVEFGEMTPQQKSQLDLFLEQCTIR